MKWYIVRHADKEPGDFYNPKLKQHDQPISKQGLVDALKLHSYFNDKTISKIYVSKYRRTKETIGYVSRKMNLAPISDSRLNEIDNGAIVGLSSQEIQIKFPDVWNAFIKRDRDFRFPDGENGEEALQRIKSFMKEIMEYNEDIILVSHDGLIRLLMCHLLEIPVYRRWDFKYDTCGITEIEYQPRFKKWKLVRFNYICK